VKVAALCLIVKALDALADRFEARSDRLSFAVYLGLCRLALQVEDVAIDIDHEAVCRHMGWDRP
jgi:hypothetical protein